MPSVTRRDLMKSGMLAGAAALGPAGATAGADRTSAGQRKNILFLCVDQLRSFADLPASLPLPNIARLRRRGWSYANYHIHEAPCGPSRSVIYTGQHIQKTGVYNNPPGTDATIKPGERVISLPPSFPTIGRMLRDQGYYTAYKGKWHLSVVNQTIVRSHPGDYPNAEHALEPYGFSNYNFDGEHSGETWDGFGHDGFIAADAIGLMREFVAGRTKGAPWFLAVNFINPHDIMFFDATGTQSQTRSNANFIGPVKTAPPVFPYDAQWNPALPRSFYADTLAQKPAAQGDQLAGSERTFGAMASEADWRVYLNYYFNCIRDVDRNIGLVLDGLDALKLADSTIVVLTSDHGEQGGAHHLRGKGGDMYKETMRVPLVVRHPDRPSSGETQALACPLDLAPTILGWAGLTDARRQQHYPFLKGVDLSPTLGDPRARSPRDENGILFNYMTPGLLSARPGAPKLARTLFRGTFDGRYKFARYFSVAQHHIPRDWDTLLRYNDLELYDTVADPDELTNLAFDPARHRDLILALNTRTNRLIESEIGVDDGSIYPGEPGQYRLDR